MALVSVGAALGAVGNRTYRMGCDRGLLQLAIRFSIDDSQFPRSGFGGQDLCKNMVRRGFLSQSLYTPLIPPYKTLTLSRHIITFG